MTTIDLKQVLREEKLKAMQALWKDLVWDEDQGACCPMSWDNEMQGAL